MMALSQAIGRISKGNGRPKCPAFLFIPVLWQSCPGSMHVLGCLPYSHGSRLRSCNRAPASDINTGSIYQHCVETK